MRNLLEFLAKYNYWLVFVLLEVVCFTLLFRFNDYQGSVWFTSANTVVGKVLTWRSEMTAYWDLRETNRELVTRNHELELQNSLLRQEIQKARLDSTKIYAELQKEWANSLFVEARVVGNSVRNKDNYITIDKGEVDGVKPEMGVVCGTGGLRFPVFFRFSGKVQLPAVLCCHPCQRHRAAEPALCLA